MNRQIQNILSLMYPFFPFLAWIAHFAGDKPVTFYFNILALPLAIYFLVSSARKMPAYLICFMLLCFIISRLPLSITPSRITRTRRSLFYMIITYSPSPFLWSSRIRILM